MIVIVILIIGGVILALSATRPGGAPQAAAERYHTHGIHPGPGRGHILWEVRRLGDQADELAADIRGHCGRGAEISHWEWQQEGVALIDALRAVLDAQQAADPLWLARHEQHMYAWRSIIIEAYADLDLDAPLRDVSAQEESYRLCCAPPFGRWHGIKPA
jgi:hypothetical protein